MSVELRTAKRIITPCQVFSQKRKFKGFFCQHFIPWPERLDFRKIAPAYLKVYLAISSQIRRDESGNDTLEMNVESWLERISRITGLSRPSVKRAMRYWREGGEIEFDGRGRTAIVMKVDYSRFIKFPKKLIPKLPEFDGSDIRLILAIQKSLVWRSGWTYPMTLKGLMELSGIKSRFHLLRVLRYWGIKSRPLAISIKRKVDQPVDKVDQPVDKVDQPVDTFPLLVRYSSDRLSRDNQNKQSSTAFNTFSERKQNFKVVLTEENWQSEINKIIKRLSDSLSADR